MTTAITKNASEFLEFDVTNNAILGEKVAAIYKSFARFTGSDKERFDKLALQLTPAIADFYAGTPSKKADEKLYNSRHQSISRFYKDLSAHFGRMDCYAHFATKKAKGVYTVVWDTSEKLKAQRKNPTKPAQSKSEGKPQHNGNDSKSANSKPEQSASVLEEQLERNPESVLKSAVLSCAKQGMTAKQIEALVAKTLTSKAASKLFASEKSA